MCLVKKIILEGIVYFGGGDSHIYRLWVDDAGQALVGGSGGILGSGVRLPMGKVEIPGYFGYQGEGGTISGLRIQQARRLLKERCDIITKEFISKTTFYVIPAMTKTSLQCRFTYELISN